MVDNHPPLGGAGAAAPLGISSTGEPDAGGLLPHAPVGDKAWSEWDRHSPDPGPTLRAARGSAAVNGRFQHGPTAAANDPTLENPLACFQQFFSDDLIRNVVFVNTRDRIADKHPGAPQLRFSEMLVFIALNIAMGLKTLPTIRCYWDTTSFGILCGHMFSLNTVPATPYIPQR